MCPLILEKFRFLQQGFAPPHDSLQSSSFVFARQICSDEIEDGCDLGERLGVDYIDGLRGCQAFPLLVEQLNSGVLHFITCPSENYSYHVTLRIKHSANRSSMRVRGALLYLTTNLNPRSSENTKRSSFLMIQSRHSVFPLNCLPV